MTVYELMRVLQEIDDDDIEVRLAHQPNWPFEYSVSDAFFVGLADQLEIQLGREDDDTEMPCWWVINNTEDPADNEFYVDGPYVDEHYATAAMNRLIDKDRPMVYIAEGAQLGYLPSGARSAIGW